MTRPRLTPGLEAELAPVEARAAAGYAAVEEAVALVAEAKAGLEDGTVMAELELSDSVVNQIEVALNLGKA